MAWDSTRPVPWQRLVREWLVYVAIMAVVFLLLFRDRPLIGIFAGLLVSGPLYLMFGYVLAKFGYQRRTLKQLRSEATEVEAERTAHDEPASVTRRPKPAPTKRTGGGAPGRPGGSRRPRGGRPRRR